MNPELQQRLREVENQRELEIGLREINRPLPNRELHEIVLRYEGIKDEIRKLFENPELRLYAPANGEPDAQAAREEAGDPDSAA